MRFVKLVLCVLLSGALLACGSSSSSGSNHTPPGNGPVNGNGSTVPPQVTEFITVDQFGYLPNAEKVAVIRNPQVGFDSHLNFTPDSTYRLVDLDTGDTVHSGSPVAWNNAATHARSGDRVWHFDFSQVSQTGRYAVVDEANGVRSPEFRIADDVYREVLIQAVRTFFYQRAGFAKQPPYAHPNWADGASHLGAGQDAAARLYNDTGNPATERDLRGGWYDAGDYNKYTNWHADYLVALLHAYQENPNLWDGLHLNIPESGNDGVPDLLHEVVWGMDWLIRMQEDNGSVLSVMGLFHASPPSAATGPSRYGPATTAATRSAAMAFALGSQVLSQFEALEVYADELRDRALDAWAWAEANPAVTFNNAGHIAAGEQETNSYGRFVKRLMAAIYLYELTGDTAYRQVVEDNYQNVNMMDWGFVYVFEAEIQHALLYFASLSGVSPSVANHIRNTYAGAVNSGVDHWPAINNATDAYRAHLQTYTWGSNRSKAQHGSIFYDQYTFSANSPGLSQTRNAALRYINYLHGVNPLGKVYLSNMGDYGAHDSVDSFYHSWFSDGSPDWDSVSGSNFGPAPGFLVGGPNPNYNWDNCCPSNCGSALCGAAPPSPPHGQPEQKSYLDFNTSWPLNSWSVTENHNAYQVHYIRLLSKFVP